MNQDGSSTDVMSMLRIVLDAAPDEAVDLTSVGSTGAEPLPADPAAAGAPDFARSSLDLLTGVEVIDFSDTIPREVFYELFRR